MSNKFAKLPAIDACGSHPVLTFTKVPVPMVTLRSLGLKHPEPNKDAAWSAI